ncbi:HNH endonuclease [Desulfosporosinus nitroreducens]|uniref:HNH endonuclease n=1 Tax=Desulfosporosinus nitroreducens TaxID=2018668 RepID=UPI00207CB103|nr:HNH endonuclease [Desulfosporosinus nitroreducens]MCO1599837.1 HNH endonuclease [Desulfosporosinus nitroreducens]
MSYKKTEEEVRRVIKEKYSDYEYTRGYIGGRGFLYLKCRTCDTVFKYNAQIVRDSRNASNTKIYCANCRAIEAKQNRHLRYEEAKAERKKIKLLKIREKEIIQLKEKELKLKERLRKYVCAECGAEFESIHHNAKYCSDVCRKRIENRYKEVSRRKQLKRNGKIDYSITLPKLIIRDNGICALCGVQVDVEAYDNDGDIFIAKGMYPSIDHIIPVSKGGTHTWDNVQLAHCKCNADKNDSLNLKFESQGNKTNAI